jgi:hypothetical protein
MPRAKIQLVPSLLFTETKDEANLISKILAKTRTEIPVNISGKPPNLRIIIGNGDAKGLRHLAMQQWLTLQGIGEKTLQDINETSKCPPGKINVRWP